VTNFLALAPLDPIKVEERRRVFRSRARLFPSDYEGVIRPFRDAGYELLRLTDLFDTKEYHGRKVLSLRHDVDHDIETALRMAEWEQARGLRATYCVLHTAWYYGEFDGVGYRHSREFAEICTQIAEMGHEINIHNNYVTLGLTQGVDVRAVLTRELEALRGWGLTITGTSGHGDPLCNKLNYANVELFEGRTWIGGKFRGGPRTIDGPKGSVALGSIPPAALGLSYDAYDLPRDIYVVDSGGRPRVHRTTRGLQGLFKAELAEIGFEVPFTSNCSVLTHPIWWDFERTMVGVKVPLFEKAYRQAGLSTEVLKSATPHEPAPVERLAWPGGGTEPPLTPPRRHRLLADQILYRAPIYVKKEMKRAGDVIDPEGLKCLVALSRDYVLNDDDETRAALYASFMCVAPNPDLVVECVKLNADRAAKERRRTDLALFAWALSDVQIATPSEVVANELAAVAALAAAPSSDTRFEAITTAIVGLARRRAGLRDDIDRARVAELCERIKDGWRHDDHGVLAWVDPEIGEVLHVGEAAAMVPFVMGAHELEVGFDRNDLRDIATALRTHALRDPAAPTDRLGPGGEPLYARPETCGGASAFLAFWPFSAGDAELQRRLWAIAQEPEFGYWFRSARALIGYSARLSEDREAGLRGNDLGRPLVPRRFGAAGFPGIA
jgi:hypothetical protein